MSILEVLKLIPEWWKKGGWLPIVITLSGAAITIFFLTRDTGNGAVALAVLFTSDMIAISILYLNRYINRYIRDKIADRRELGKNL